MMVTAIKNKQDLVKALNQREISFVGEYEAVNETGLKAATDKVKTLLRQRKKPHLIIVERT
jgi:hypothetical protein